MLPAHLDVPPAATPPRCTACATDLAGAYCHACGERQPRPEDESLAHFLREQFREVTSADGRMWSTVRALGVPGKLTDEYFSGRRGRYLRPVRLFLVVNVAFFLFLTALGGQGIRGGAALHRSDDARAAVLSRAAARAGVSDAVYDAAFTQQSQTLAPTLIAVFVPMLALALALVLAPSRQSAVRHVVFSTHLMAALMVVFMGVALLLLLLSLAAHAVFGVRFVIDDGVLAPAFALAWAAYLGLGIRRVYRLPWWSTAASTLAVGLGAMAAAFLAYQALLFYVTLWTVSVPA